VLSKLRKKPRTELCAVGLHAGELRVARVTHPGRGRPQVALYACQPFRGEVVEALQTAKRQLRLDRFRIATLLGPDEYQLHMVDAPNVPEAETKAAVRWRVKDLLDYPPEAATVDTLPVPGDPRGSRPRNVFAVSARNERVAACMAPFAEAKLPLHVIDIPETCQRNVAGLFEEPGRGLALLTFGDRNAMLTITLGGELYVARTFDVTLPQLVAATGENRVATLDRAVLELQRSFDHFDRQFGGLPLARLLVAPIPDADGIAAHLATNLYMPVEVLDLAAVLDLEAAPELRAAEAQAAALPVLGCALRAEAAEVAA
jgi:MSHA biogenesis protein MshI